MKRMILVVLLGLSACGGTELLRDAVASCPDAAVEAADAGGDVGDIGTEKDAGQDASPDVSEGGLDAADASLGCGCQAMAYTCAPGECGVPASECASVDIVRIEDSDSGVTYVSSVGAPCYRHWTDPGRTHNDAVCCPDPKTRDCWPCGAGGDAAVTCCR